MKKPDWIIHGILEDDGSVSYHTHGLDKHEMLELELNLSMEGKQAMYFINLMDRVKQFGFLLLIICDSSQSVKVIPE